MCNVKYSAVFHKNVVRTNTGHRFLTSKVLTNPTACFLVVVSCVFKKLREIIFPNPLVYEVATAGNQPVAWEMDFSCQR